MDNNNNNANVRLKHKTVLFVAFVDSSKNSASYIFIFVMGPFEEVQQISHLSISSVSTHTLFYNDHLQQNLSLCSLYYFPYLYPLFSASVSVSSSWPAHWSAKWAAQEPWRVVNLQRWELLLMQTQGKKVKNNNSCDQKNVYWLTVGNSLLDWLCCGGDWEGSEGYSCIYWCDSICLWEVGWRHSEWGKRQEWWHCPGETLLHLWGKSWDFCQAVPG